jgi:hypothetical protein
MLAKLFKELGCRGDEFSMAMNMYTNGHAYYKREKITWDNNPGH